MDQIKDADMAIDPDSSLGPDGFNEKNFQVTWDVICYDLANAIQSVFGGVDLPRFFTHTYLVMIPKVDHPQVFSYLRPISLCNVTTKLISKLINSKISSILPRIIS